MDLKNWKEGGKRMRYKPMILAHGRVFLPLTVGKKAQYLQNGNLRTTGRILRILAQTEDYVKFETESYRYCIEFYGSEAGVLAAAA